MRHSLTIIKLHQIRLKFSSIFRVVAKKRLKRKNTSYTHLIGLYVPFADARKMFLNIILLGYLQNKGIKLKQKVSFLLGKFNITLS